MLHAARYVESDLDIGVVVAARVLNLKTQVKRFTGHSGGYPRTLVGDGMGSGRGWGRAY